MEFNSKFSVELFKNLDSSKANTDVTCSPLSAALGAGMAAIGARGNTLKQIGQVLFDKELTESDLPAVEEAMKQVMNRVPKDMFKMANLMYGSKGSTPKPEFAQKLNSVFGTKQLRQLDVPKEGMEVIKQDLAQGTGGKVRDVDNLELSPEPALYLVNALYFKVKWKYLFKIYQTRKENFVNESGQGKEVLMMYQCFGELLHTKLESLKAQACMLPLADDKTHMLILLPDKGTPIKDIEQKLDQQFLMNTLSSLKRERGARFWFPKLCMQSCQTLNGALSALGAKDMFDSSQADFSGIGDKPLAIKKATQKVVLEIDEEGTTQPPVAAFGLEVNSKNEIKIPASFHCDHPFLFMILQQKDQKSPPCVMLVGAVRDVSSRIEPPKSRYNFD